MYEIWLVMNIVWEIALGIAPWLIGGAALWLILVALAARRRPSGWRAALPGALLTGAVVAVAAFLAVPGLTKSSLGELAYWVDWANLVGVALGFGGIAAAFAWPLLAWRGKAA
jgi:hypothetical protein